MVKLSDKEQQFILQLIKSCEYHGLSEKQSIESINNILNKNISRRTYYSYKSKLYEDDIFNKLKGSIYSSPLDRISVLLLNDETTFEVKAKVNKVVADQFPNKVLSFLLQSQYNDENNETKKDKLKNALVKMRHFKEVENLSKDRLNSLHDNATVREEFIKCGKEACNLCPHGPYYYAYWKEKTKDNEKPRLRKEYLGNIDPRH